VGEEDLRMPGGACDRHGMGKPEAEPLQILHIEAPSDYMGEISKLVSNRRGQLLEMNQEGALLVAKAKMPVGELFGWSSDLRSATGGRGNSSLVDQMFEKLPDEILLKVISKLPTLNDVISLSLTCRKMHQITEDDKIWKPFFRNRFPDAVANRDYAKLYRKSSSLAHNIKLGVEIFLGESADWSVSLDGKIQQITDNYGFKTRMQSAVLGLHYWF